MSISPETYREVAGCACLRVRKAARSITRYYDRHFADLGLRSTQFAVLSAVGGSGEAHVSELAEWLGMDHSTLVRNLRPLRDAGLVESRRGTDRRKRLLSLTGEGTALLERAIPVWREAQSALLEAMGDVDWFDVASGLRTASNAVETTAE